jgi:hypothetical protein
LKNEDEFYFKMIHSKMVNGEHVSLEPKKTLNEKYIDQNKNLAMVNMRKSIEINVIKNDSFRILETTKNSR